MVQIDVGQNYRAARKRSGTSARGDWELLRVTDKGGKQAITIWVTNQPCNVNEGDMFRVESIEEVKFGFRKDGGGFWKPDVNVNATVSKIESEFDNMDGVGEWPEGKAPEDPWAGLEDFPV